MEVKSLKGRKEEDRDLDELLELLRTLKGRRGEWEKERADVLRSLLLEG